MALKTVLSFNGSFCRLGKRDFRWNENHSTGGCSSLSWRVEVSTVGKLEREGVWMKPVDDENVSSSSSSLEVKREMGNGGGNEELKKWNKGLASLPKPLSATDFSDSNNGYNVRVAYQGSPGACSEAAALKAYPECKTVPCEQFEVAFKAVELWVVDKAVLPIENTFSGSIHRNYDLLLCHRLHIVGEVIHTGEC